MLGILKPEDKEEIIQTVRKELVRRRGNFSLQRNNQKLKRTLELSTEMLTQLKRSAS